MARAHFSQLSSVRRLILLLFWGPHGRFSGPREQGLSMSLKPVERLQLSNLPWNRQERPGKEIPLTIAALGVPCM